MDGALATTGEIYGLARSKTHALARGLVAAAAVGVALFVVSGCGHGGIERLGVPTVTGEPDAVLDRASDAIKQGAGVAGLKELAAAQLSTGYLVSARATARRAIGYDADDIGANVLLARAESQLGRPREAVTAYRRAAELAGADDAKLLSDELQAAHLASASYSIERRWARLAAQELHAASAHGASGEQLARGWLAVAEERALSGQTASAGAALEHAKAAGIGTGAAGYVEGEVRVLQGDVPRAAEAFRRWARRDSSGSRWLRVARRFAVLGRADDALKAAQQASELRPTSAEHTVALATYAVAAGRHELALGGYLRLLRESPVAGELLGVFLSGAQWLHANAATGAALELSTTVSKRFPESFDAALLVLRLMRLGEDDAASVTPLARWVSSHGHAEPLVARAIMAVRRYRGPRAAHALASQLTATATSHASLRVATMARLAGLESDVRSQRLASVREAAGTDIELAYRLALEHVAGGELDAARSVSDGLGQEPPAELSRLIDAALMESAKGSNVRASDAVFSAVYSRSSKKPESALRIGMQLLASRQFNRAMGWLVRAAEAPSQSIRRAANDAIIDLMLFNPTVRDRRWQQAIVRWFADATERSVATRARQVRENAVALKSTSRAGGLSGALDSVLAELCRWEVDHHGGPSPHEWLGSRALAHDRVDESVRWSRAGLRLTFNHRQRREAIVVALLGAGANDEARSLLADAPVSEVLQPLLHEDLRKASAASGEQDRALGHAHQSLQQLLRGGRSGRARAVLFANGFTSRGDPKTARSLLEVVANAEDISPDVLLSLGRARLASGDKDASEHAFRRYIEARPARRYQRIRKVADVCLEFGPLESSAAYLELLLAEPQRTETRTYQKLAWAYRDLGDRERLLAASRAFLARPQNRRRAVAEVVGQLTDAGLLNEAAGIAREGVASLRAVSVLKAAFRNALVRRNSDDALAWGSAMLERERYPPKRAREVIRAAVDAGLPAVGVKLATAALRGERARNVALVERGRASMALGDRKSAQADFIVALTSASSVTDLIADLAHIHRQAGALDDLVDLQRRAIAVTPGRPELLLGLASTLMELGRPDDGKRAVAAFLQQNPRGQLEAGSALARGGQPVAAIDQLAAGIAAGEASQAPAALTMCAQQALRLGVAKRFEACASGFLAAVPPTGESLATLAVGYETAGSPELALRWFEAARRAAPTGKALLWLHSAYIARGDAAQADAVASEFLALGAARDVAAFGRSRQSQGRQFDANLTAVAQRYLDLGEAQRLTTLIATSPPDVAQRVVARLWRARAKLAVAPGDIAGPLTTALAAVEGTPRAAKEEVEALIGVARALSAAGDSGAARRLLERARRRGWESIGIDVELVRACLETGDRDCAWKVAAAVVAEEGLQHAPVLGRALIDGGAVALATRLSDRALRRGLVASDTLWIAAWAGSPQVERAPPAARAAAHALVALDRGQFARAHEVTLPLLHVSQKTEALTPSLIAAALDPAPEAADRVLDALLASTPDRRWVLSSLWSWADERGSAALKAVIGERLVRFDAGNVSLRRAAIEAALDAGDTARATTLEAGLPGVDSAPTHADASQSDTMLQRPAFDPQVSAAMLGDAAGLAALETMYRDRDPPWRAALALAVDQWRQGKPAIATAMMKRAEARFPARSDWLELVVDSAVVGGDVEGARRVVERAVARGSVSGWTALTWVLDAATVTPVRRSGIQSWLSAWLSSPTAPRPPNPRAARWLAARQAAIAENSAGAAAVYEAVLGRAPDDLAARNGLAWTLALDGRRADVATRLAESALQQSPLAWTGDVRQTDHRPIVLDTLAWAHHRAGQHQRAQAIISQALTIGVADRSARAQVLFHAGVIEASLGNSAASVRAFERCQRHLDASAWALRCARQLRQ